MIGTLSMKMCPALCRRSRGRQMGLDGVNGCCWDFQRGRRLR
jgi:hypothetical protein